jgi:inosine-uridine nucleoside N-ribohydrolase
LPVDATLDFVTERSIHLDTDLGSDTDDLCALAMLLGWEGAHLIGVTTVSDPGGIRAGFTHFALDLASRSDIPVASGAGGSLGGFFVPLDFPNYWPQEIDPRPSPPGAAIELLEASAGAGATIVAVGPYTNLAMLEAARPGLLASVSVVVMGGHVTTPRKELPSWGSDDDFNVQQDAAAAAIVFERCRPTVVPLAACLDVHLREAHLQRLRDAGALGRLLADQAEMHARDNGRQELGRAFEGLPDDLLNFHYDPLACAVALGWDGTVTEEVRTRLERQGGRLLMRPSGDGRPLRVVTKVDGRRFEQEWLAAVELASTSA